MTEQRKAIETKVKECIAIAEQHYKITLPNVTVKFDLRGKASGQASYAKSWGGTARYELRFNREHIALGGTTYKNLYEDTVPHEVAHFVCFAFPQLGRAHNYGWKAVCLTLGGNGNRCYTEEDAPEAIAKQRPYVYITTKGKEVRVTPRTHKKIQTGAAYQYRGGLGIVNQYCVYNYNPAATPVAPTVTTKATTTKATTTKASVPSKGSNAEEVRRKIAQGWSKEEVVDYAIHTLGMKKALATTYVRNNWR